MATYQHIQAGISKTIGLSFRRAEQVEQSILARAFRGELVEREGANKLVE